MYTTGLILDETHSWAAVFGCTAAVYVVGKFALLSMHVLLCRSRVIISFAVGAKRRLVSHLTHACRMSPGGLIYLLNYDARPLFAEDGADGEQVHKR